MKNAILKILIYVDSAITELDLFLITVTANVHKLINNQIKKAFAQIVLLKIVFPAHLKIQTTVLYPWLLHQK